MPVVIDFMENKDIYKGVIVPMVTPVNPDLTIDRDAVKRIVESFISAEVVPFVLGSTGEAPSLASDQRLEMVEATVEAVRGRAMIYAGISGNCLEDCISEGTMYVERGVGALVATPPSYYPMNSVQMVKWFTALADVLPRPLIIYNMPAMTKHNIPLDVVEKLSHHTNIVGLKDSERDENRLYTAIDMFRERNDFVHLTGWAAMSVKALMKGSSGIVPSTGNLTPQLYKDLFSVALAGDVPQAEALQEITDYISGLYQNGRTLSESIPALKAMMFVRGLCNPDVVAPMYRMDSAIEAQYIAEIKTELIKHKYL